LGVHFMYIFSLVMTIDEEQKTNVEDDKGRDDLRPTEKVVAIATATCCSTTMASMADKAAMGSGRERSSIQHRVYL